MKLVRLMHDGAPRYGCLRELEIVLIEGDPFSATRLSAVSIDCREADLLAPAAPSKVVAVGLNYRDHAKELGMEAPDEPLIFLKAPSAVIGPGDPIVYPDASEHVEYEAELAVVIKRRATRIRAGEAAQYILGFTCANDITARDLQARDGQWTRAKSFDTFCPLGPHLETEWEAADKSVSMKQNGQIRQESDIDRMIFSVLELTAFISGVMTLLPGDVILTGTPPGVGPVAVGDTLNVEIEGIGSLENKVVGAT